MQHGIYMCGKSGCAHWPKFGFARPLGALLFYRYNILYIILYNISNIDNDGKQRLKKELNYDNGYLLVFVTEFLIAQRRSFISYRALTDSLKETSYSD